MGSKVEKDQMATSHIRFPKDLAHQLNVISTINGESIAVLCDRLFRGIVANEHRAAAEALANQVKQPAKKK